MRATDVEDEQFLKGFNFNELNPIRRQELTRCT
jgi:hypothetical protein